MRQLRPSLTGRVGDGWGSSSRSSEPVSRPTALKIPPQVPLTLDGGAAGGSAVGRLAHGLPLLRSTQRRGRCASLPGAAVAAEATAHSRAPAPLRPTCHQAQRLARRSSRGEHFDALRWLQRHGIGRGGCPGWRSGTSAANEAQRRARASGQFVKRASFARSVKEPKPAIPGHGNGPLSSRLPACRPDQALALAMKAQP